MKTKNRYHGSITLIVLVKIVTYTLQNILQHLEAVLLVNVGPNESV